MGEVFGSDAALLEGCIAKNKRAWDTFVERFSRLVYWSIQKAFAQSVFEERVELVGDVYQQVFEILLGRQELVRLREAQNIRKFIVRLAYRRALNFLRDLKRHERREESFEVPEGQETGGFVPEADIERARNALSEKERDLILNEALDALNEKERACLELCYVENKSYETIAGILEIPVNTVSVTIWRTKAKIKKAFLKRGWEK